MVSSLTYPDINLGTTEDPGLTYVTGKPGLVLRKERLYRKFELKKIPK